MAKGKLTGSRPFAKGDDPRRNLKGAPKIPFDIVAAREQAKTVIDVTV